MRRVLLLVPHGLLRRFRALAGAFVVGEPEPFHLALWCAAAEFVAVHGASGTCDEPPASLVPAVPMFVAAPPAVAESVEALAQRSGLTPEQAWHRVVLEFCERSEAPGVELEPVTAKVGAA